MLLAGHSLMAMKNAPPASHTSVLQRVSTSLDLAPFTVTHSSYADYSPITRVDSLGLTTAPMSPTPARKVYKAANKSRSVTQLIFSCSD